MHATFLLLLLLLTVGITGLVWFLADIRYLQLWGLRRAELGAQDNSRELDAHFQSRLKCRRPMYMFFQWYALPGLLECDYALFLSNQGEHERALVFAQMASHKARRREAIYLSVLPAESNILLRLGRYEEAKQVVQLGRQLLTAHSAESSKISERSKIFAGIVLQDAIIETNLGHLDAGLKLCIEASAAAVSDPARILISSILTAKGRFQEALEALMYEPSDFYDFLDAEG